MLGAVLLAVSGCSGDGSDGGGGDDEGGAPLSVPRIKKMAREPGPGCPVAYDVAAAARAAGVEGRTGKGKVTGERGGGNGSPLDKADGALVDCAYRIGGAKAELETIGVNRGSAVPLMLPMIMNRAGLSMDRLQRYAKDADAAGRGKPVLTPSGNVASVRLPVDGKGDLALVVISGTDGKSPLSKGQVRSLAKELAKQAHT